METQRKHSAVARHFEGPAGWWRIGIYGSIIISAIVIMIVQHQKKKEASKDCEDAIDEQRELTYILAGIVGVGLLGIFMVNLWQRHKNKRA